MANEKIIKDVEAQNAISIKTAISKFVKMNIINGKGLCKLLIDKEELKIFIEKLNEFRLIPEPNIEEILVKIKNLMKYECAMMTKM